MSSVTLKGVIFFGSAKDIAPAWGGPKRLGDRVLKHVVNTFEGHKGKVGDQEVSYNLRIFDPLENISNPIEELKQTANCELLITSYEFNLLWKNGVSNKFS